MNCAQSLCTSRQIQNLNNMTNNGVYKRQRVTTRLTVCRVKDRRLIFHEKVWYPYPKFTHGEECCYPGV